MRRAARGDDDVPGQDSFLDVVANIVGILIILVMVVGVRAGQARRAKLTTTSADMSHAVSEKQALAASFAAEVRRLDRQQRQLDQEVALRRQERQQWETLLLVSQQELESRRQRLSKTAQADFDLQLQLAAARTQLDKITQRQVALESEKSTPQTIENRPTPLSKTVLGREVHFRLSAGRVAPIPLDLLLQRFKSAAQQRMWKLADRPEMTDVVGPIGGFRLRYRLQRVDIPPRIQLETGQGGSIVRLVRWELIPVANDLGEPVETALAPGSKLRAALPTVVGRGGPPTVTIWTYPDSFAALRSLKEQLHAAGYLVAVRPLPHGVPIGGSPQGSHSAAQ
jgi:hypothetical protein